MRNGHLPAWPSPAPPSAEADSVSLAASPLAGFLAVDFFAAALAGRAGAVGRFAAGLAFAGAFFAAGLAATFGAGAGATTLTGFGAAAAAASARADFERAARAFPAAVWAPFALAA